MKARFILGALMLIAACGGSDGPTAPPPPPRPNISGTWSAAFPTGATINMLVVHDTISNAISGNGTLIGTSSIALTISGNYAAPNVSVTMSAQGYQPINLTGQHATTTITGTLNGSGFNNSAATFFKK